ncbi:MAG TPA: V-type ATP synthase subunit F [Vicinamibacterales bacterium]|jgi:vacuolar-type H+-ATPase subunit F/Vma7
MLAGVETEACATVESAAQAVNRALGDAELGVLLVDEALMTALDPGTLRRLEASERPLAITVPLDVSAGAEREHLEQMIQRIIGYQVRLE